MCVCCSILRSFPNIVVVVAVPAVTGIVSSSTVTHTLINVIHGTGGFKPFPVLSLL